MDNSISPGFFFVVFYISGKWFEKLLPNIVKTLDTGTIKSEYFTINNIVYIYKYDINI
jgi:hypothetical protein